MMKRTAAWFSAMAFALCLTMPSPARAEEWLRADSAHLEVYSNAGRTAIESFTRKIETYDAFLHLLLGVPPGPQQDKLHVYLLASDGDMKILWPAGGFAGFYDGSGDEPMLVVHYTRVRQAITKGETASDADDTAFHEYTHFFQQAHFPTGYPGWVIEGYAQYLQTIRFDDDAVELGHGGQSFVWRLMATWLPWDKVLRASTGTLARDQWNAFYGQAWLLTHYLSSDPQRAVAFNRYLVKVANGGDPVTSLTDALGIDLSTLSQRLERYYKSPIEVQRIKWHLDERPAVAIQTLSPAQAALVLLDARTRYFVGDKDRAAFVDKVRAIAARYPDDRFALLAAARVDMKYGDAARADATLAPLLSANPNDADALLLRARARMRRAEAEKDAGAKEALLRDARRDLNAAMTARPDSPEILYYQALVRKGEAGYPGPNIIIVLAHALELRPQAKHIRLELGQALLMANRRQDAMNVLQSLLNDPHDEDSKKEAEAIIGKYGVAKPEAPAGNRPAAG